MNFLSSRGFHVVKEAHGNATFTPKCLSMYLNLDYPPPPPDSESLESQSAFFGKIIENAEAPSRLKASGYEVTALSIFATAGQERYYYFPKISAPSLPTVLWNKTTFGYLDAYRTRSRFGEINLKILGELPALAAQHGVKPKFVYAHLMMPHPPYLFDRDGHRIKRGMGIDDDHKEFYLGQLIYENTLLTNAIASILKNSATPPVIILQGDHGYRSLPGAQQVEEASTILNAMYLPGFNVDSIPPGVTPVNTFRLVFNHYFGEHYSRLPDTTPNSVSPFIATAPGKP